VLRGKIAGRGSGFICFGVTGRNGFVRLIWQIWPQGLEPFQIFDGTAVETFGLGLIAQEEGPGVGGFGHTLEAFGEGVVAVLLAGSFDIAIADEFRGHGEEGLPGGIESLIEARGKEAGFQAGGAEQGLLGQGDALDGEELLGVDRLVDGNQVGFQIGDLIEVFQAHDGEGGGGETVFAGVLRGAGFAFGGTGSGGLSGIGAIGRELFFGDGF
jgi:hypothetical protein